MKTDNKVKHPSYYNKGKIQVIDFIVDQDLDFCLGNVVKYISRAGLKYDSEETRVLKGLEDLEKAKFYLDFYINQIKQTLLNDSNKTD